MAETAQSRPRIVYVLGIFPKLTETFIANELAEPRRRAVEVRILALRPSGADLLIQLRSSLSTRSRRES
jgi:hypothetical protein